MTLTENTFRHWLTTGDVPGMDEIGMYSHHHPKYRDDCGSLDAVRSKLMQAASDWNLRSRIVKNYSFAIPCAEALDAIASLSPILEVGAGTGFWSQLLAKRGADVVAADVCLGGYGITHGIHFPIEKMEAVDAVRRWPDRNVLMVWPCYNKPWAHQAALAMLPGRSLALVSEGCGGCVADDDLFNCLTEQFDEVTTVDMPVWYGINDRLTIDLKRGPASSSRQIDEAHRQPAQAKVPDNWSTGPDDFWYFSHSVDS